MKDCNQMDSQGFILTSQMTGPLFLLGPTDTVVSSIRNSESRLIANYMHGHSPEDGTSWGQSALGGSCWSFSSHASLRAKGIRYMQLLLLSKIAIHWCSVG